MKFEYQSWILLIVLSLVWGSSFILMERSMSPFGTEQVLGPLQVGSLRICFAGTVLLPFALKHLSKLNRQNFGWLVLCGLTGNFFPAMLFTVAETGIESSLAGLLNMSTSIFVVLIGLIIYKQIPSKLQLVGIMLGAFGLIKIFWNQIHFEANNFNYALLIFIATLCYAISVTTIKYRLNHLKPLVITALSFFLILFPALIVALSTNAFSTVVNHPDGKIAVLYLLALGVIGTALAVFLFNKLVSMATPLFSSGVTYLIPIVAVLIGVWDGEKFNPENIIWIALILIGVYLLNKKQKPPFVVAKVGTKA
ncbi:DMT family transporter [Crocinitomix sp.]|nr:DMT family transporter [Crocinitomix sp.]